MMSSSVARKGYQRGRRLPRGSLFLSRPKKFSSPRAQDDGVSPIYAARLGRKHPDLQCCASFSWSRLSPDSELEQEKVKFRRGVGIRRRMPNSHGPLPSGTSKYVPRS